MTNQLWALMQAQVEQYGRGLGSPGVSDTKTSEWAFEFITFGVSPILMVEFEQLSSQFGRLLKETPSSINSNKYQVHVLIRYISRQSYNRLLSTTNELTHPTSIEQETPPIVLINRL